MISISRRATAAVVGAVLLAAAGSAASAHGMSGGHGFGGPGHFGGHGHGFRGGYFIGFDDSYAGYDYGGGCGYLRHKAHETGRPYWWRHYEACARRLMSIRRRTLPMRRHRT